MFIKRYGKIIGIICLILGIIVATITIFEIRNNEKSLEETKVKKQIKIEEKNRTSLENEAIINARDNEDIDFKKAQTIMNLKINISDQEMAAVGDTKENLLKNCEKFLIEKDFWSEVHTLKSNNIITIDYLKNEVAIDFKMDNKEQNTLQVIFNQDSKKYFFNWY